ncbi:MAG TPA: hypothetical protein VIE88_10880 [Vicinamibacteria bacterium]
MIAEVRANVAEPGGSGGDFYTEAELLRWLNLGALDLCTRGHLLTSDSTADSVMGQKKYGLPNDFILAEKVFYDGRELVPVELHQLLTITDHAGLDAQGAVEHYYVRGASDSPLCLFLWKVPSAAVVAGIHLFFVAKPEAMTTTDSVFGLSSEWANAVILYASARAHRKQRQLGDARVCQEEYERLAAEAESRRGISHHVDQPVDTNPWETWGMRQPRTW